MRASITHVYGRDFGLGTQVWLEDPLFRGKYTGNPSLSTVVSSYMISLRRRKVRAGYVVTSARAIDEATIKAMFLFNEAFPAEVSRQQITRQWKEAHPEYWGGRNMRVMLQWLDLSAFLCLLRYDEALHLQWHHIHFEKLGDNKFRIRIELPFRKTHQNGGCAPFVLYNNPEKPWMCPIRAFAMWSQTCSQLSIPREGYVFRKRVGFDNFSANPEDAMTSEVFLECFRNNLLDVGIDPRPYGTHSFRRGGCQYLAMVLRWPIRNICTWGGWSENFNSGTIFKYLLSWTDAPLIDREDYMNPDRPAGEICHACGRSCSCA
ncbi:hypothetical protein OH76DRAFT_1490092 [Lentinus brumalis]|uniref:DNA breaking-rejoining enzyme n=1 Tax=Lentinus brumalis TaxID=2498619 RepID=A0A371CK78_9APHY|nr:hypothetical protein OH76DRAFT_1490293 [Polyporus brumalis]RDX40686.1 hypothetical protein OH76DRAFT_1490092 [Polyporus brumalis]